jgi:hypothetical protein
MHELLGKFAEDHGLTTLRLVEVACEAVLLTYTKGQEDFEEAFRKRPPQTLESELEWHREVSRRVLARELLSVYRARFGADCRRHLKKHARTLVKEAIGHRIPKGVVDGPGLNLTAMDVAYVFQALGVKSRLLEHLLDTQYGANNG